MSTTVRTGREGPWVLAWAARVVTWPLSAAAILAGLVGRLLLLPFRRGPAASPTPYLSAAGAFLAGKTWQFPPLLAPVPAPGQSPGPWNEARRRLRKSRVALLAWIGTCAYVYLAVAAQFGWVAADYAVADRDQSFTPPTWFSGSHPLGTDLVGRDVMSLALRGVTTAMWIGSVSALTSCVIGTVLGCLAGYFGRWVDVAIVWLYTTLESIPHLLLLLAFAFVLKKSPAFVAFYNASFLRTHLDLSVGLFTIIVTLGLTSWVGVCRTVRGEVMRQRDRDYVTAARALGMSTGRTLFRHVLPNVFHLVLVSFSLLFISTVKFEVILSFLGLGLDPDEASWGSMIAQSSQELMREPSVWWQLTTATVFMFGLVLFVNLFADALRDALDPRLKH
jgi:peptide/nickel transport system permease protein